jgi:hypothetical protein
MAEEVKKTEAEPAKPVEEKKPLEKTAGEIINDVDPVERKAESKPEMVPLSSLMEFKNENKDLKKAIKDLEKRVNDGEMSKADIKDDLSELAEEFDTDPKFVRKLSQILEARAEKKADEKIKPILERDGKITKKERDELIDTAFQKEFNLRIERMPEYKDIVDADVIKALSLLPQNANKTFPQLIEEAYGRAVSGKRTIDPIKPGGGKDPDPIDYARAKKDTKYFEEIMANKTLKDEYNKNMLMPRGRRS